MKLMVDLNKFYMPRMKTMDDHLKTCAHYGDSMMPCTCGAEPDIVGCHYDENGKLITGIDNWQKKT